MLPTSVHIQGDTYPLTWDQCVGCEAYDDGASGGDVAAGDTTYTVTEYFSMQYDCAASADTAQVKYKYVARLRDVGRRLRLRALRRSRTRTTASQTINVWWEDVAPVDNIACDVGVLFQVHDRPVCPTGLYVRGTELPLDWSTGVELLDDGTGGDVTASDGIYSAEVVFPTGTYKFLEYKYFCASSDTTGVYECDVLPNRNLTLDDVNGCVLLREGPMLLEDLWNWCEPVTGIGRHRGEELGADQEPLQGLAMNLPADRGCCRAGERSERHGGRTGCNPVRPLLVLDRRAGDGHGSVPLTAGRPCHSFAGR